MRKKAAASSHNYENISAVDKEPGFPKGSKLIFLIATWVLLKQLRN